MTKKTNWWMDGYNAAMKAKQPNELNDALALTGEGKDEDYEMFRKGWRSVWSW